jgi:hypothetical protein
MPLLCALQPFFTIYFCTIIGQYRASLSNEWDTANVSDYQHKKTI